MAAADDHVHGAVAGVHLGLQSSGGFTLATASQGLGAWLRNVNAAARPSALAGTPNADSARVTNLRCACGTSGQIRWFCVSSASAVQATGPAQERRSRRLIPSLFYWLAWGTLPMRRRHRRRIMLAQDVA